MKTGILPDFAYAQRTPDKREVGRSTRPRPIEANAMPRFALVR